MGGGKGDKGVSGTKKVEIESPEKSSGEEPHSRSCGAFEKAVGIRAELLMMVTGGGGAAGRGPRKRRCTGCAVRWKASTVERRDPAGLVENALEVKASSSTSNPM